jgi:hypothetical protein
MALLPDLLCSSDDSNHNSDGNHHIKGPFRHFGNFFIFNSFDDTICLNYQQGFVATHIVDQ